MRIVFSVFVLLLAMSGKAQGSLGESVKQQLVKDWERAKAYTGEYLQAMPSGKYSFRAADSIRTFAQQMLHLAQGNVGISANGTSARPIFQGQNLENSASAQAADSVRYYVNASYDYVIASIKAMDVAKLTEVNKQWNFSETRLSWLLKAFEHQTHHRGQTTIYLRAAGIRPPQEKLF
jgi:uncharacterized damage-inducible protein DinB